MPKKFLRQILQEQPGIRDLNGLKLLSRCGMGHCQGRYCHYQLRTLMADVRGQPPEQNEGCECGHEVSRR
jgi:hypothetical protein